jgi:hypothetical protein
VSPPPWRRGRPAVVVALALLLLAVGTGVAVAAWQSSGTGSGTGRAGTLAAPTDVAGAAPGCTGTTGTVRFSWTAPPGAVSYQLEVASNTAFTSGLVTGSTTNTSATASQANATTPRTLYFRTRAVAGTWVSPNSAVVSALIGPCLLP